MKLFGIDLFSRQKRGSELLTRSQSEMRDTTHLPDFYKKFNRGLSDLLEWTTDITVPSTKAKEVKRSKRTPKHTAHITPKAVYELKMLNSVSFKMNTDTAYIDKQLEQFKEKLGFVKGSESDMRNAVIEIQSVIMRLENRRKYESVRTFYEQYAYTTNKKIGELLELHAYLDMGLVEQFVPDLPQEAVTVMAEYRNNTKKLCNKLPIFYIIADKKDFKKTNQRRDPILLAQSPFGHFWQILGAWDEEMLLLDEL